MKRYSQIACAIVILMHLISPFLHARTGPFDGQNFRGRIAYSCDGNNRDRDDLFASAVTIAIFNAFNVTSEVVHFDYNSILGEDDPEYLAIHEESVRVAANRFGLPDTVIFDDSTELTAAVNNIRDIVNASSPTNPLYFVIAGPMEVPWRGIHAADPEKRQHVYCISHTVWNDMFFWETRNPEVTHNKRDLIELGVNWIQIPGQGGWGTCPGPKHGPCPPEKWALWDWMRCSGNDDVAWLYERLKTMGRPDCSDSGMAYFLLCGNQQPEVEDLRRLLHGDTPEIVKRRPMIRLEAENFKFHNYTTPARRHGPVVSQRLCAQLTSDTGHIQTVFNEIYAASGQYDVEVRYFDGRNGRSEFALFVGGVQRGESWRASADPDGWRSTTIANVPVGTGDEIMVTVRGDGREIGRIDYVQLNYRGETTDLGHRRFTAKGPLDDPHALPGQIIVAGTAPGYLKYNGGGAAFLCGPDNPEDFLFLGKLNGDGTRSGPQMEIIDLIGKSGANAFHFQMTRMRRCNIKGEGDDTHCPFIDHDPSKPLNKKVLDQWDGWLDALEERGVVVHLEFYNDATDVEMMGWRLDEDGNLHPDERRWIEGIVRQFKHHKNIVWGIEESCNKLPRARVAHFKRISQLIAETDDRSHPVVQSFVTPDTRERDLHPDRVMSGDYRDDPHIDIVTWLHVAPHGEDYEAQHQAYLKWAGRDNDRFIPMRNETEWHRIDRTTSRRQAWACALAGMHALEAQHNATRRDGRERIIDDGKVAAFMEQTDWHTMKPQDDLAAGSTKWVLANPGSSYIAYSYECSGPMGIKNMTAGRYDLMWFDAADGNTVRESDVSVGPGDVTWLKPASMGGEIALYVRRPTLSNGEP